jgi:hypothetical protein
VLSEAQDYVKLDLFVSGLPSLYPSVILTIIEEPWFRFLRRSWKAMTICGAKKRMWSDRLL